MSDAVGEELLELNTFDCSRRMATWRPPNVSLLDEEQVTGDFVYYHPSVLLSTPKIMPLVEPFFAAAGELLPLWFNGELYTLLNVTNCIDALDQSKTEWLLTNAGEKVEIQIHFFDANKLDGPSIFKIPETSKGSVLTWEKDGNPEREFKAFVEQNNLTGLLFEELWDSEQ